MAWTRTYAGDAPQRVNKWLAQSGVCSRREAEALIAGGHVEIDGVAVNDVGRKIAPGQTLTLNKDAQAAAVAYVLHKPVGVVSAQPEAGEVPAARLLTRENQWGAPSPAPRKDASLPALGRLDKDSRGLLILASDGVLAKALVGPESEMDKEYLVAVIGEITDEKLDRLRHGLELDERQLKPAEVEVVSEQRLRVVLTEGRKRQIRRMCELVDLKVVDLFRRRIGPLTLGDMPEGKWRALAPDEREALIAASKG